MRNQALQSAIDGVLNAQSSTMSVVTLEFLSATNPTFSYSPLMINEVVIEQKFHDHEDAVGGHYADVISATFDIASSDYAKLYDIQQDLKVIMTIQACDKNGLVKAKSPATKTTFKAMIMNARDLRKELTDVQYRTTPDTTMTVQLVEDPLYTLRLKPINVIYRAMTMSQVIRHIAASLSISKISLTAPDSDANTFDQIYIPPYKEFGNVFEFLQQRYGVYMCGLTHYYTSGVLYVYAPYDTNAKTTNSLALYQAEQGYHVGASSFHSVTSTGDWQVVINEAPQMHDLSTASAENHGTSKMFLRAANTVDGIVSTTAAGLSEFADSSAVSINLKTANPLAGNTKNNQYTKTTDNVFAAASELVSHHATIAHCTWHNAVPLVITPGMAVSYFSDEAGKILKRTGICEAVTYGLTKSARTSAGVTMLCMAHLTVRLDPTGATVTSVG